MTLTALLPALVLSLAMSAPAAATEAVSSASYEVSNPLSASVVPISEDTFALLNPDIEAQQVSIRLLDASLKVTESYLVDLRIGKAGAGESATAHPPFGSPALFGADEHALRLFATGQNMATTATVVDRRTGEVTLRELEPAAGPGFVSSLIRWDGGVALLTLHTQSNRGTVTFYDSKLDKVGTERIHLGSPADRTLDLIPTLGGLTQVTLRPDNTLAVRELLPQQGGAEIEASFPCAYTCDYQVASRGEDLAVAIQDQSRRGIEGLVLARFDLGDRTAKLSHIDMEDMQKKHDRKDTVNLAMSKFMLTNAGPLLFLEHRSEHQVESNGGQLTVEYKSDAHILAFDHNGAPRWDTTLTQQQSEIVAWASPVGAFRPGLFESGVSAYTRGMTLDLLYVAHSTRDRESAALLKTSIDLRDGSVASTTTLMDGLADRTVSLSDSFLLPGGRALVTTAKGVYGEHLLTKEFDLTVLGPELTVAAQ